MKKFFYSVLAVAALIGCAKEKEAPVNVEEKVNLTVPYTIKASFETDSKVTYSSEGKFSWNEGDLINVRCTNPSGNNSWFTFTAQADGASTEFKGDVTDYFRPSDYAFFPGGAQLLQYNASTRIVRVPRVYYLDADGQTPHIESDNYTVYVSSSNPLAFLPSVGRWNSETETFAFSTAFGVLKVSMTDVPAEAAALRLYSAGGVISNYLVMGSDGELNIGASFSSQYSNPYLFYHFKADSEGKATLYIPLPVGDLTAGSKFDILDADDNILFSKEFVKDVKIERNKIVTLASFKAKYDWTSLGSGKYIDKPYLAAVGASADLSVDVQIEQDASNPGKYRIIAPYAAYNTATGYSTTATVTAPNDLVFNVYKAGDKFGGATLVNDGIVYFDPTYMGIIEPSQNKEWFLAHRTYFSSASTEADWIHSCVLKWKPDGSPAIIQLAPCYYWVDLGAVLSDCLKDGNVQILFPGETEFCDTSNGVSFVEISDDTPAQPIAKVNVLFGNAYGQASLVIAADADAAAAAFADASAVAVTTSSGEVEVKLPADAASGKYAVYAKLAPAEGMNPILAATIVSEEFQYDRSDESWTSLGTGKFFDSVVADDEGLAGNYVEVEIIQNPNDANNYRVVDPYGALAAANNYVFSTASSAIARDPYLNLTVKSDGTVYFDKMNTGFYYSSSQFSGYFAITYPTDARDTYPNGKNYVTKYAADGKPANIYLAPTYQWPPTSYWTADNYIYDNGVLEIVFPGSAPIDIAAQVAFSEIVDDTPAQAIAKVLVSLGDDLASANLVIAASDAAAASALANSSMVTVATGTGEFEVKLPADTPSGTYYVYAQTVPADGLAPACSDLVVSAGFQYSRADVDLGITADMIVGTYTTAGRVHDGSAWGDENVSIKVELSNDDNAGDIMITAIADIPATDDMGVYGTLDGKTGEITFPGNQVFATYDMADEGDPEELWDFALVAWAVTSSGISLAKDDDITFLYDKDAKTLKATSHSYFGIWCYASGSSESVWRWNIMYFANPFTLNTPSGSGAPAAAPRGWSVRKLSGKDASTFVKLPSVSNK